MILKGNIQSKDFQPKLEKIIINQSINGFSEKYYYLS